MLLQQTVVQMVRLLLKIMDTKGSRVMIFVGRFILTCTHVHHTLESWD